MNFNVGIGTTSPGSKLDVALGNNEHVYLTGDGTNPFRLSLRSGGEQTYFLRHSGTSNLFQIGYDSGGEQYAVTLNSNGNLGIGTTSPTAKFHVGGVAGTDGIKFPDGTVQTTAISVLHTSANAWSHSIILPSGTWVLEAHAFVHQHIWSPASLRIDGVVVQTTESFGQQEGTGYTVMFGGRTVSGGTRTVSISAANRWGTPRIMIIAFRISP